MNKVKSVSVRLATEDDKDIEAYDNTKLQAVNTCPTWGVLRYQMHKAFASNARAMALEAGSAMHEVFAAVRLWQLWKYDLADNCTELGMIPKLVQYHGERLFGADRFSAMLEVAGTEEDERTQCINFCLQSLYSSGFYDDPSDNRRTMSNLEEAAIMYIDRWDFKRHPIWIRDVNDPESDVGIEIAFDVVLTYTFEDGIVKEYRFTGKLDGLHHRDDHLIVGENKTGARLDDAWRRSFEMSSQVTGYCLAGSVFTQENIANAVVWGVAIPLPKSYELGGLCVEHVTRESFMFERWFDWFLYSVQQYERYKNDPHNAPKFTHSCNRYFRSCAFIEFCASSDDEQRLAVSEMVDEEWSPLH